MSATLGILDAGVQAGLTTLDLASANGSTITLTPDQARRAVINTTGTATGANSVVFPVGAQDAGMSWIVNNLSGQNLTCKLSGQTGIVVATSKSAVIVYAGSTDVIRGTADVTYNT